MSKIYIGLSTKKKFYLGAELIKWGEGTEYSHVYIRRVSNRVGEYVYQATASGAVNFMGIDIFNTDNIVIEEYEFDVPDDKTTDLIAFFIKNAGRGYSKKQVLVLARIILAEKCGCDDSEYTAKVDANNFICSELGAIVLRDFVGITDLPDSLDLITPKRLRPYLLKYGNRVI